MEWVEWLLSREFRQFVLDHGLFVHILFLARLVGVTVIELTVPARTISYRSVMVYDLIGFYGGIIMTISRFARRFLTPSWRYRLQRPSCSTT